MERARRGGRAVALTLLLSVLTAAQAFAQIQGDDGPMPGAAAPGARRAPLPAPAAPAPPPPAQVQPRKRHHDSGVGAAIGAGVVGGLVGGALLNSQRPTYAQPGYAPPPPPPPAYDDVEDEPECHLVRKPVYDEDGEIVDYRTRRICR